MDLDVVFLGTGGSVPSARRNTAAVLVRRGGDRMLFDCGEGTQRQMQRSVGDDRQADMGSLDAGHGVQEDVEALLGWKRPTARRRTGLPGSRPSRAEASPPRWTEERVRSSPW